MVYVLSARNWVRRSTALPYSVCTVRTIFARRQRNLGSSELDVEMNIALRDIMPEVPIVQHRRGGWPAAPDVCKDYMSSHHP